MHGKIGSCRQFIRLGVLQNGCIIFKELKCYQIPNMAFVSFDAKLVKAANTQGLTAIDGNGLDPNHLSEELQNAGKFIGK